MKLIVIFHETEVSVMAEPLQWRGNSKFNINDNSPEAKKASREEYLAVSGQARQSFYAKGYYIGPVSGELSGRLTLSLLNNGIVHAVIVTPEGPAFNLTGRFDETRSDPVRPITLSGQGSQGSITLSGQIHLEKKSLQGTWTARLSSEPAKPLSGEFSAAR